MSLFERSGQPEAAGIQHSAIYEGWVRHRRFAVTRHEFRYPLYMMLLDLDEIERVLALHPLWGKSRWALSGFHSADYFLGDTSLPQLRQRLLLKFQQAGLPACRVSVLTNLRGLGVVMNPLSCYFGFDQQGQCVGMLAEVTNTPWGERHHYWLSTRLDATAADQGTQSDIHYPAEVRQRRAGDPKFCFEFSKAFHVSPFNPMDMSYQWLLNCPQELPNHQLISHLALQRQGQPAFDATLCLQRQLISRRSLGRLLWRYPLQSLQVAIGIYWQAARLWWRGARFHKHPGHRPEPQSFTIRETHDEIHHS